MILGPGINRLKLVVAFNILMIILFLFVYEPVILLYLLGIDVVLALIYTIKNAVVVYPRAHPEMAIEHEKHYTLKMPLRREKVSDMKIINRIPVRKQAEDAPAAPAKAERMEALPEKRASLNEFREFEQSMKQKLMQAKAEQAEARETRSSAPAKQPEHSEEQSKQFEKSQKEMEDVLKDWIG